MGVTCFKQLPNKILFIGCLRIMIISIIQHVQAIVMMISLVGVSSF